jgi:signal transduction histidine kinase
VRSLYLRIWLTVLAALALFALASGWLLQRHLEQERERVEAVWADRFSHWAELIQNSLPERTAPESVQAESLLEWARRLQAPLALEDANGHRIVASVSFSMMESEGRGNPLVVQLDDGRKLLIMRPEMRFMPGGPGPREGNGGPHNGGDDPRFGERGGPEGERQGIDGADGRHDARQVHPPLPPPFLQVARELPASIGLAALLALLFLAVAAGAYPVVRRLTRRLEKLKQAVEAFGAGALSQRVSADGGDEVAAVAASFNRAADRIQALVQSNQSLLANASHELRSPLARLKMAVSMMDDVPEASRASLRREVDINIRELDELVEEILLSSRLEAGAPVELEDPVDLAGLCAEEASRVGAQIEGEGMHVVGSDRLLRRAVRNLLENARRYAGGDIELAMVRRPDGGAQVRVCDRGAGVPESERERIFEPFYRMAGHAERAGGVGLGLALVRQIAQRHGGDVRCDGREGGGSCFVIDLPASRTQPASGASPRGAAAGEPSTGDPLHQ